MRYEFYEQSKLTKLLGYQCIGCGTDKMLKEYYELNKEAEKDNMGFFALDRHAMDFYALGVMHGKQIERQKRKKHA